jgi:hypothetical protein
VIRFSYDAVRSDTYRCVAQLQALLRRDVTLAAFVVPDPVVEQPEMSSDSIAALNPPPTRKPQMIDSYFDEARRRLDQRALRRCQAEAFGALANYYAGGGQRAACVMSVGAGKTALGVVACLAFTRRRALIVTPGA